MSEKYEQITAINLVQQLSNQVNYDLTHAILFLYMELLKWQKRQEGAAGSQAQALRLTIPVPCH